MRALIVDDEPLARRGVLLRLKKFKDIEVIGECGDGASAVTKIVTLAPDLVFLDVQMPEMDGFEVLRALPVDAVPAVIFLTAYEQHALRAFEVHALDYLVKLGVHKRGDVWNLSFDVFLVGAEQSSRLDIAVINRELQSLAEQGLDHCHDRTLSQIVSAGLETQTEHSDVPASGLQHHIDCSLDLQAVAYQNRTEQRSLDIKFLRFVVDRPKVLRKTRASESETWLQIIRRQVELGVLAEDVHYLMAVDSKSLAHIADLIGERDFQGVKTVGRVLHHLGFADSGYDQRGLDL